MKQAERHKIAEVTRLRRLVANEQASAFEREDAARRLREIEQGPTCAHCEQPVTTHNGAVCPVLARWRRRHGKDSLPTAIQAAELRRAMDDEVAAKARAARARELKNAQGKLF